MHTPDPACPFHDLRIAPAGAAGKRKPQWRWNAKRRRLENVSFGAVFQVVDVVDRHSGALHHEAVMLLARRAEVHVVIRERDHALGFVRQRRELVVDPDALLQFSDAHPGSLPDPFSLKTGVELLECVQGLARRPCEEVLQEMGLRVRRAKRLGIIKENPGLGGVGHQLYATVVSDQHVPVCPEPGEQIHDVVFVAPGAVRTMQTICGLTQGALWRFRQWGLAQRSATLWYRVAEKM